jgi:hypothetical protein
VACRNLGKFRLKCVDLPKSMRSIDLMKLVNWGDFKMGMYKMCRCLKTWIYELANFVILSIG